MDFDFDSRFSALSTATPSPPPSSATGGGKSVIELLEDQLAAERRVRELERQLEQRNNPPQQAMPVNGAGSHGNAGRANGVCGVFWDYESCRPPPSTNGPALIRELNNLVSRFGAVRTVQMYEDAGSAMPSGEKLRSSLLSCNVKIQGRGSAKTKGGADHRLLCDAFGFALDFPAPGSTIVLISSDTEYSGMLSALKSRGYGIVLIENSVSSDELKMNAQEIYKFHDLVRAAGMVATPQHEFPQPYSAYPRPDSQQSYQSRPSVAPGPLLFPSNPPTPTRSGSAHSTPSLPPSTNSLFSAPFSVPAPSYTPPPVAPATSTPQSGGDFAPLVEALSSRPAYPAPLRSLIGGLVKQMDSNAFGRVGATCAREYFEAAKQAGMVEMGAGDVNGRDWIALVQPGSQPRPYVPRPSVPITAPANVAAPDGNASRFQTLIDVLTASSYPKPLRAVVCADLLKIDRGVFKQAGVDSWRDYVGAAVKAGVVHIGKGEKLGSEWIALASGSHTQPQPAYKTAAAVGKLDLGSAQARRLVQVLLRTPANPPPLRSRINDLLLEEEPTFVSSAGFDTWGDFSKAAAKAGLVELGMTGTSPWISLVRSHWLVGKIVASSPSVPTPPSLPTTSSSSTINRYPGMGAATAASFATAPGAARPRLTDKHLALVSMFRPLCLVLLDLPRRPSPPRSTVQAELERDNPAAFESVHAGNFKEYIELAAEAGIVEVGTSAAGKYVRLVGEPTLLRKAAGTSWAPPRQAYAPTERTTATRQRHPTAPPVASTSRFPLHSTNEWDNLPADDEEGEQQEDAPGSPGWDIDPPTLGHRQRGSSDAGVSDSSDVQVVSPPPQEPASLFGFPAPAAVGGQGLPVLQGIWEDGWQRVEGKGRK